MAAGVGGFVARRGWFVVVTRVKVKGKTNSQLLGGTKKSSVAYNISVANHHATPIYIQIQDQVPISSDKEVFVTVDEMGGGILEEKIGVLTWEMSLLMMRQNQPRTTSKIWPHSLGLCSSIFTLCQQKLMSAQAFRCLCQLKATSLALRFLSFFHCAAYVGSPALP